MDMFVLIVGGVHGGVIPHRGVPEHMLVWRNLYELLLREL